MSARPRIAILGGGVGSVTAAIELSKGDWQSRFQSITLYQQGWRLGGKGASGRGENLRIEEHGLHIWFGFYENAFRMMQRCHDELDRLASEEGVPRWPLVFTNVEDSFRECIEISLTDYDGCSWKLWTADFFDPSDDRPWLPREQGAPGPDEFSVVFYVARCLELAADLAWSLIRSDPGLEVAPAPDGDVPPAGLDEARDALVGALGGDVQQMLRAAGDAVDVLAADLFELPVLLDVLDLVVYALQLVLDFLRGRFDRLIRGEDALRRAWYVVDLMVAIVRGLIEDDVITTGSFDVVNDEDFCEWLLRHGAHRDSVQCALVRTVIYDLPFAYEGGDPQRPAAEAGTALRGLMRTFFTYRGALMWKMNAGMGDVVFAPMYELLIKRGVEVKFFHRVEKVSVAAGRVEEIEVDVQAEVPASIVPEDYLRPRLREPGSESDPDVWPNSPLVLGDDSIPAATYESWYAERDATRVDTKVLRRGGPDEEGGFELVVFGFPISCVPHVAAELPANSARWQAAVDALGTVPTQAMQLWLNVPAGELAPVDPGIVVGGFVEPFDTWADMYHLIPQEQVPGMYEHDSTIAYFCNALKDSVPPPRGHADAWLAQQLDDVVANGKRYLRRELAPIWTRGTSPLTRELYWDLLVDPRGRTGEERLGWQYFRANVEPSERYVLSVPGSSRCRIDPADTGFANLYAVGDWTSCTINAGCVEAAVISGLAAANGIFHAVGADAQTETIIGRSGP